MEVNKILFMIKTEVLFKPSGVLVTISGILCCKRDFFQGYNFVVGINTHSYLFVITVVFLII